MKRPTRIQPREPRNPVCWLWPVPEPLTGRLGAAALLATALGIGLGAGSAQASDSFIDPPPNRVRPLYMDAGVVTEFARSEKDDIESFSPLADSSARRAG